jgi:hypothetical protein
MSTPISLCLFDCAYDGVDFDWQIDKSTFSNSFRDLQKIWANLQSKYIYFF